MGTNNIETIKKIILLISIIFLLSCNDDPKTEEIEININPFILKHSHNDYRTREPLYEALRKGCQIIEADIILSNSNKLVLAHDKTWYNEFLLNYGYLESVYLEPMNDICRKRNYDLYLFIELKDGAPEIKDILYNLLKKYQHHKLHYLIGAWDFNGLFPDRPILLDFIISEYCVELNLELSDSFFMTNSVETIDLPGRILK